MKASYLYYRILKNSIRNPQSVIRNHLYPDFTLEYKLRRTA